MWEIEIRHDGLNKFRHIRGTSQYIVEQKAAAQRSLWDAMWERRCAVDKKRSEREKALWNRYNKKSLAAERTKEAEAALKEIEETLNHTLKVNDNIDWDNLLDKSAGLKGHPVKPIPLVVPEEPQKIELELSPLLRLIDSFLPFLKIKEVKTQEVEEFIKNLHIRWENKKIEIDEKNKQALALFSINLVKWEKENASFLKKRDANNAEIIQKKEAYFSKIPDAVIDHCELVLSRSRYPDTFPQQFDVEYNPESKIIIIDYSLPDKSNVPLLKEVKYNASKDEFKEINLSEKASNELYDSLLYQITLRTIHEVYEADAINAIESVIFNGYVKSVDKGTGKDVTACILSIHAKKEDFIKINLASIDPKECFKTLKGVGSSKLHGLASIAPILTINREDKRFVSPYTVVASVDEKTNIAAMDWQDFENLIREIFEKEFSVNGGEVKITRASRDEGVDAVAFDPDPIRGGKIVIQAKRYTNTVGVSAVRDLYGTVMNEGAMKGILVTTTDYGPDAYKFAQDKPLTLLNGSNLLSLLEKYGHKAKIDIKEARKTLNLRDKSEGKNY